MLRRRHHLPVNHNTTLLTVPICVLPRPVALSCSMLMRQQQSRKQQAWDRTGSRYQRTQRKGGST